jgi:3-hydroxyacyl-CoA dehydrogenase
VVGAQALVAEDTVAPPRSLMLGVPARLTDLVGIDGRLGIAGYLAHELAPRFEPPRLMVERGELGRKSGRGFYNRVES